MCCCSAYSFRDESQEGSERVSLETSMRDQDGQLRRIHRIFRNLKSKINLLEELVRKRDGSALSHQRDGSDLNEQVTDKQRNAYWDSLKLLPTIAATDSLFNARNGSLDGINLRQLMDHIQSLRSAYANALELNKPSNAFPSLTQLSARVIGYSIINYDFSYGYDKAYEDLGKLEKEARQMEIVDYVYSCVPPHLQTLLVPSHALSLLFSNNVLSNHHPTISSLLPTTSAYGLEFQDIIYHSLAIAFAGPTLPHPNYLNNICLKFNCNHQVIRSLIKLLPAFEPALSTCRAVRNMKVIGQPELEIQDISPLIQTVFQSSYETPVPPASLYPWLDIDDHNSLFDLALKKRIPKAQNVLILLAVEVSDRMLRDPKYHHWFKVALNLCAGALCVVDDDETSAEMLVVYMDNISRVPFSENNIRGALDAFRFEHVFSSLHSQRCWYARTLIDVLGDNNLIPAQLGVLRRVLKLDIPVDGLTNSQLRYKERVAQARFEESKTAYVQHTTFKTPKKMNASYIEFTPYTDDKLQSHRKALFTPGFPQWRTPYTNPKTQVALGPHRPVNATFRVQQQRNMYGFGSPFVIERNWRRREEGEDEGSFSSISSGKKAVERDETVQVDAGDVAKLNINEAKGVNEHEDSHSEYSESLEQTSEESMPEADSHSESERMSNAGIKAKKFSRDSNSNSEEPYLSDDLAAIVTHKPKRGKTQRKPKKAVSTSSSSMDSKAEAKAQRGESSKESAAVQSDDSDDFDALTRPKEVRRLSTKAKHPTKTLESKTDSQDKPLRQASTAHSAPHYLPKRKSLLSQTQLQKSQPERHYFNRTLSKRKSGAMDDTTRSEVEKPRKSYRTESYNTASEDDRSVNASIRPKHKSEHLSSALTKPHPSKDIRQNLLSRSLPRKISSDSLLVEKTKLSPPRQQSLLGDLNKKPIQDDPLSKVERWMQTTSYTKADVFLAREEEKRLKDAELERERNHEEKEVRKDEELRKSRQQENVSAREQEKGDRRVHKTSSDDTVGRRGSLSIHNSSIGRAKPSNKKQVSNHQKRRQAHRSSLHKTSGPIELSSTSEQSYSRDSAASSSEDEAPSHDRLEMLREKVMSKYKNKSKLMDGTLSRLHSRPSDSTLRS
ncbi:hypothetical protein E3P99_01740 [Wallemia hederae]|uniref:Uncharacterized protein n=1 Tax=Wallemia hederae TaxID=1540922 RepID=A0A4T0FR08_9BASI|nr:hypothetical protein E3P99_01740 [Wallemia hederae]